MAAVSAELKFRNGETKKVKVQVENNLGSLITGLHDLNANLSQLLSELVAQENESGDCAEGEEEEDIGEEDEEPEDFQNFEIQPPAKRSKT